MLPTISRQIFFHNIFFTFNFSSHTHFSSSYASLLTCSKDKTKQKKTFFYRKNQALSHQKSKSSFNCTVSLLFLRNSAISYLFFATLFTHHHSSYHSLLLLLFFLSEYLITTVVSVGFTFTLITPLCVH